MKGRKPKLTVVEAGTAGPFPAPSWLPPLAAAEWQRIAPGLSARGLLTDDTSGTVESYCVAQGQVHQFAEVLAREGAIVDIDDGPVAHPANRLLLAGELGITPHRFLAGQPKPVDELEGLDL